MDGMSQDGFSQDPGCLLGTWTAVGGGYGVVNSGDINSLDSFMS